MNSEELEQSLRSEFEGYIRTVLADLKQETAEFQSRMEAEFEKQRAQMSEAFKSFSTRFDSGHPFDAAFSGSVGEHLRLARDEGARIAADAMVEAENLGHSPLGTAFAEAPPPPPPPAPKYDAIREAVDDISSRDSQSAILKSLVHHAASFAPRGAFFIIKSDSFAGWKVFGGESDGDDTVRDLRFPVADDSILGAAVRAASTVEGGDTQNSADANFTGPLRFSGASKSMAIPLMARGRAVAVLYADDPTDGSEAGLNRDALETMVRVAGLTVELMASMQTAKAEDRTVAAADLGDAAPAVTSESERAASEIEAPANAEERAYAPATEPTYSFESAPDERFATSEQHDEVQAAPEIFQEAAPELTSAFESTSPFEYSEPTNPFDAETAVNVEPHDSYQYDGSRTSAEEAPSTDAHSSMQFREGNPFAEESYPGDEAMLGSQTETGEPAVVAEDAPETSPTLESSNAGAMIFDPSPVFAEESAPQRTEQPREQYEPAVAASGHSAFVPQPDPVIEAPVVRASQPRLSERNVDLPIEVPDEERRIHNDARRFARLLVSEIKLYNEKRVTEGREASDLYQRLREAIDRSREMYDKRVQPPVAAKFDYFHYELVNSLAEGRADKLGSGYPGATI